MTASLDRVEAAVLDWLPACETRPMVLGLCGSQGSGKSTLAAGLRDRLAPGGVQVAILSLDDLYLSGASRRTLAQTVHPLLRTRGVPLTHDVERGIALIREMRAGRPVRLPRFEKATDEPLPVDRWPDTPPPDILVLEGWCVGARPQGPAALVAPVNALERDEDRDGRWRRAVDAALGLDYARLFAMIDRLVLLAAPDFAIVRTWRMQQEDSLRARMTADGRDTAALMDADAVDRFVQHYERITRWILEEMPARADLILRLDAERRLLA